MEQYADHPMDLIVAADALAYRLLHHVHQVVAEATGEKGSAEAALSLSKRFFPYEAQGQRLGSAALSRRRRSAQWHLDIDEVFRLRPRKVLRVRQLRFRHQRFLQGLPRHFGA